MLELSPAVSEHLWHNKNIQEAKDSQEFALCPLSPVPALLLQAATPLLHLCLQGL